MRMENVVKQTELLEKTGVYDEDLKRRFSLTLKYSGLKGKKILVIGMNPASNSVQVFDNTTNYLLNNLGMMGYSEIIVWNLFADICTKLKPTQAYDNAENMEYLQTLLEVLHIELDKESIRDFMEEHSLVNNKEQVSIGKRAMEWLLQYISKNYTQFLSADSPETISNCRGRLERTQVVLLETNEESTMRLSIAESEFIKILKEGKFSEKITVLKDWKNMGYLKCQKDRYVSRVKIIGDIKVKGYIIQLPVSNDRVVKSVTINGRVVDKYDEHSVFSIDEEDDDLNFPEDNE